MEEKLRIYIGGLGSNVQEDDLRKTFTSPQLGIVQSVEIIRSKGRSFGYLEYVPSSEKGLAKLFSTYNGCMWKGGKLKLEKARENYLSRLNREWTEDAEAEIKSSTQKVDVDESSPHLLQKPKKDLDINKLQLNLFFPKLRKIKPIPFKGTGKHKYSFQRIEVPPLPAHFCDCEEHSGPPETTKRNITVHHEMDAYGVNEDELNMMQSILNKLLEKDGSSKMVNNKGELTEEISKDTTSYADNLKVNEDGEEEVQVSDDLEVDDDEEEQPSDEDSLVINIVGQPSKRVGSFEDWGQKTTVAANQDIFVREPESFSKPVSEINGSNREKRKHFVQEINSNDIIMPSKKKLRKGGAHDSVVDEPVAVNTHPQPTDTKPKMPISRKAVWKDLIVKKENTAFHISDILANPDPSVEADENDGQKEQSSQDANSNPDVEADENDGQEEQSSQDANSNPDVEADENDGQEEQSSQDANSNPDVEADENDGQEEQSSQDANSNPDVEADGQEEQSSQDANSNPDVEADENDGQEEQSSQDEEPSKDSDTQPTNPSAPDVKIARGSAWLQKSSWLQLVADPNKSAFNLSQILPGSTVEKQEPQKLVEYEFSNSGNENVGAFLTKGKDHVNLDREQPDSDSKVMVEEEDDKAVAPICGTSNMLQSSRVVPEIVISETCPFMKSAASMKEWAKTKAAISASHKKTMGKGKEMTR